MNFWYRFERYSGTDWCATLVPVGVLWWYRYVRYGGTDSSATMVPFRRYYQLLIADLLDALEEDYRRIYPDDDPPFAEGYRESLRKLVIPK